MSEIAIGIDLGTSNTCVAVMRSGEVEVLANAYGEHTTASVVAFREDGAINVGNAAKANIIHNPERTVHSSKRLIGRYFFSEEVKKAQAICSYEIVDAENHALHLSVLKEARLVDDQRQGQHVVYRLRDDALANSVDEFFGDFRQCRPRSAFETSLTADLGTS